MEGSPPCAWSVDLDEGGYDDFGDFAGLVVGDVERDAVEVAEEVDRLTAERDGALLLRVLSENRVHDLRRQGRKKPRLQLTREDVGRSEEHPSELQSLMRISYAVVC